MTEQIEVLYDFGGKETREQRIFPGVYAADDPRLLGLADYLVKAGHAVEIKLDGDETGLSPVVTPESGDLEPVTSSEDGWDPAGAYDWKELAEDEEVLSGESEEPSESVDEPQQPAPKPRGKKSR